MAATNPRDRNDLSGILSYVGQGARIRRNSEFHNSRLPNPIDEVEEEGVEPSRLLPTTTALSVRYRNAPGVSANTRVGYQHPPLAQHLHPVPLLPVTSTHTWPCKTLHPLKIKPSSIAIPSSSPELQDAVDTDVRMTPRDQQQLQPSGGGVLRSPLKQNMRLQVKPDHSHVRVSEALPVSSSQPTMMKGIPLDARYLADAWVSYESPSSVYAMLANQQLDSKYQQGPGAPPKLVTPLMQLQQQQQQQQQHHHQQQAHQLLQAQPFTFGLQPQPSMTSQLQPFYPQQEPPILSTNPHAIALASPHPTLPSIFPSSSTHSIPDLMTMGVADPSVFLPQGSPTHIMKHLLPPMVPYPAGINVKDLTLNELRPHFNKPMAVVAKELGVCITLMKKICRKNGLVRWPHRRIRSLVNRITSLQVIASNSTGAERKRFQTQIMALREELSAVIQNPNEKSRKAQADAKARSPSAAAKRKDDEGSSIADGEENDAEEEEELVEEAVDMSVDGGASGDADAFSPRVLESGQSINSIIITDAKESKEDEEMRDDDEFKESKLDDNAGGRSGQSNKKRKDFFHRGTLHPPPPIKIPCHREHRQRSYSAPERRIRRGLAGKADDNEDQRVSDGDFERPSSTTNSNSNGKRGSISSILCNIME